MKKSVFVIFIFLNVWWCSEETAEVADEAAMEKTEKDALYSAIQGFVGNEWNGSDLYPDPCGWTPIQVLINISSFIIYSISMY